MIKMCMEISAVIAETILLVYFLSSYFSLKNQQHCKIKYILFFIIECSIDLISLFFNANEMLLATSSILIGFLFLLFLYKGNLFEKIVISILSYMLFAFINLPVLTLLGYVLNTDINSIITDTGILRFFVLFITKLLYFLIAHIIVVVRNNRNFILKKSEWIYLILISIIILSINLIIFVTNIPTIYKMVEVIILCVLELSIIAMVIKMSMSNKAILNLQKVENEIKLKELELVNLNLRYNELNEFKHNTKNQLQNIKAYINDKKEDECIKYIDSITNEIYNIKKYINTKNLLINAVLNNKISLADKNNIKVRTFITIEFDNENIEMYISNILSNLLDNAIEACLKNKKDSEIRINAYVDNQYKVIKISNTIEDSVLSRNRELNTTKKDKNSHGIGLKSVKNNVRKINGTIDFIEDRGMFTVIIMYK